LGKNLGDDLREGKATLPLIAAMQRGTAVQSDIIQHAIETGGAEGLDAIVAIVRETGALDVTREAAAAEAARAIDAARALPANEYSQGLLQLAAQLLQRRA
jgi:octaprenyl-diphosphate synthase